MSKVSYFIKTIFSYFSDKNCPSCKSKSYKLTDTKYFISRLFECESCHLMYRHPKDSETFNLEFYQKKYTQNDGITTDIIDDYELKNLINSNFSNSEKNVSRFVKIFNSLGFKDGNLVDYGSSWGYMSYQFINYGFNTQSFEISEPRANFGNLKLGLNITTDLTLLTRNQDLVFSSHVIEHVPSVSSMIESSLKLLKKGGFFISECPNGSKKFRDKFPHLFSQFWGEVHQTY